jgi:hypothetical protein
MTYITPSKQISGQNKEPHNILEPDSYRCKDCGEMRFNNLEVEMVINSPNCTVYQIFCNTCSKITLIEVVSAKIAKALERLDDLDIDGAMIHLKGKDYSPVRSALTGRLIDRKSIAAGEKE